MFFRIPNLSKLLIAFLGIYTIPSFAVSKNFDELLHGISMGGGTVFEPSFGSRPNFDPVSDLAGTYTTLGDTNRYYLLPLKIGYFVAKPETQFEVYARHLRNTISPWYGSGLNSGKGSTQFASWGIGGLLGASMIRNSRFRFSIVAVVEYLLHSAELRYTPSGGSAEVLKIKSSSAQAGGGFLGEIYLGDLWMLNLTATYLYGLDAHWSAANAGTFMGSPQSGYLRDSSNAKIKAVFGGIQVETSLRLAFY
jgi:hypothetical protein